MTPNKYPIIEPPGFHECRGKPRNRANFGIQEKPEIPVYVFDSHRFAFYAWYKFAKKYNNYGLSLISIDWHQDLSGYDKNNLEILEKSSGEDIDCFCCQYLNAQNDTHIHAAAYWNLIGDIYLLCKSTDEPQKSFFDKEGKEHTIHFTNDLNIFLEILKNSEEKNILLDIDLDYFTNLEESEFEDIFTPLNEAEIKGQLNILQEWFLPRLRGITIAREPMFCGSIKNSNYIYNLVSEALFENDLVPIYR